MNLRLVIWACVALALAAGPSGTRAAEPPPEPHRPNDAADSALAARLERAARTDADRLVGPHARFEPLTVRVDAPDVAADGLEFVWHRGPGASGLLRLGYRLSCLGTPCGEAQVVARGVVRGPVLVAKRVLPRGVPIGPDALALDPEGDLTRVAEPLRTWDELTNRVPLRTIGAGRALSAELVGPPPVVRRGQSVEVQVQRPTLTVTARATVKLDGAAGETIPVENEASGARLLARIETDGSLTVVGVSPRRRPR